MEENEKINVNSTNSLPDGQPQAPEQPLSGQPPLESFPAQPQPQPQPQPVYQPPINAVHSVYGQGYAPVPPQGYAPVPVSGYMPAPHGRAFLPLKREKKKVPLSIKDFVFFIVTLLVSILFVRFSFFGGFNLGFTVSFFLLFSAAALYTVKRGGRVGLFPLLCGVFALALSGPFLLYTDNIIKFVSFCGIGILTVLFLGGLSDSLHCADGSYMLGYDILKIIFVYPLKHFTLFFNSIIAEYGEKSDTRMKKFAYVLMGIAVALPLLGVVVTLLMESDAAFESLIKMIFGNIADSIVSIVFGLIAGAVLFFTLFALHKGVERKTDENCLTEKTFNVSAVLVNTVLTLLSACYCMYLLSQTAYFFSAFSGLLPADYTAAEYARRGFFEMCAVVFINLIVFFAVYILTKRLENGKLRALTKGLLTFVSLFTLVLITVSFSKMYLYIDRFGLTRPRLLTSVLMLILFLVIVTLTLRLYFRKLPYMKLAALITAVVLTGVAYLDIDTQIARYNTALYRSGKTAELDVATIGNLSAASIPYLIELYNGGNREQSILAGYFLVNSIVRYGDYNWADEMWNFNANVSPIAYNRTFVRGTRQLGDFYDKLRDDTVLYKEFFKAGRDEGIQNRKYTAILSKSVTSPQGTDKVFVCVLEREYSGAMVTVWHQGKPIDCGSAEIWNVSEYDAFDELTDVQWMNEDKVTVTVAADGIKSLFIIDLKTGKVDSGTDSEWR